MGLAEVREKSRVGSHRIKIIIRQKTTPRGGFSFILHPDFGVDASREREALQALDRLRVSV